MQKIVRGGIDINSAFSYYLQPTMNIKSSVKLPDIDTGSGSDVSISKPTISSATCLNLYHGWNVFGEIYPWYQIRSIKISWRGVKVGLCM